MRKALILICLLAITSAVVGSNLFVSTITYTINDGVLWCFQYQHLEDWEKEQLGPMEPNETVCRQYTYWNFYEHADVDTCYGLWARNYWRWEFFDDWADDPCMERWAAISRHWLEGLAGME